MVKKKLKNEIEKKKKRGSQRIKNQLTMVDYSDPRSKDQNQTVHNICAPKSFVCISIDYGGTINKIKSFKLSTKQISLTLVIVRGVYPNIIRLNPSRWNRFIFLHFSQDLQMPRGYRVYGNTSLILISNPQ